MTTYDPFECGAAHIKLVDCRHTAHVTLCQHKPRREPTIDRIKVTYNFLRTLTAG